MNSLMIKGVQSEEDGILRGAIYIDQTPLLDLIRRVEKSVVLQTNEPKLLSGYEYLPLEELLAPSVHLLGVDTGSSSYEYDSNHVPRGYQEYQCKHALLDCSCGSSGCWPLVVRIQINDDSVIWSEFENVYRPRWKYPEALFFEFDKAQYLAAIRHIHN